MGVGDRATALQKEAQLAPQVELLGGHIDWGAIDVLQHQVRPAPHRFTGIQRAGDCGML
jgi:hypothetical protein